MIELMRMGFLSSCVYSCKDVEITPHVALPLVQKKEKYEMILPWILFKGKIIV